jgi:hypothetical protein
VLFKLFIAGVTPVSLLESESGFEIEIATQLTDTGKRHLHICGLWFRRGLVVGIGICIAFAQISC